MRTVAVIASASGRKTTVGRELARRLGVPFVELDASSTGRTGRRRPTTSCAACSSPCWRSDGWVIDGGYRGKLGDLVLEQADVVVWLDLPVRVWLPRSAGRAALEAEERNGNRETLRGAVWGRDALIPYALRMHRRRRRHYPVALAQYAVVRLRTRAEVERFLSAAGAT